VTRQPFVDHRHGVAAHFSADHVIGRLAGSCGHSRAIVVAVHFLVPGLFRAMYFSTTVRDYLRRSFMPATAASRSIWRRKFRPDGVLDAGRRRLNGSKTAANRAALGRSTTVIAGLSRSSSRFCGCAVSVSGPCAMWNCPFRALGPGPRAHEAVERPPAVKGEAPRPVE